MTIKYLDELKQSVTPLLFSDGGLPNTQRSAQRNMQNGMVQHRIRGPIINHHQSQQQGHGQASLQDIISGQHSPPSANTQSHLQQSALQSTFEESFFVPFAQSCTIL